MSLLNDEEWMNVRKSHYNKRTILATGCWDLLHYGHIEFLRNCTEIGGVVSSTTATVMIVAVLDDIGVKKKKGPLRPIQNLYERIEAVKSLGLGQVYGYSGSTVNLLNVLRPHIWAKGYDYVLRDTPEGSQFKTEAQIVCEYGGTIAFIPPRLNSTTSIIERILERYGKPNP